MTYLVSQIIIAILLAAALGFLLGWWVRGLRGTAAEAGSDEAAAPAASPGDEARS